MKKKFDEIRKKAENAKDFIFSWKGALLAGGGIYVIWSCVNGIVYLTRFLDKVVIVVVTALAIYFFFKWRSAMKKIVVPTGEEDAYADQE